MQIEVDCTPTATNGSQMIVENDNDNSGNFDNQETTGSEDSQNKNVDKQLTEEDLSLLCDLFYLPFEHGGQGIQLLQEFNWLKVNAQVIINKKKNADDNLNTDVCNDYCFIDI